MASLARADLESLLRARKLERTLTTALPPDDCSSVAPSGIPALDARLGGGVPRGHLSELVGPRSSGRTSLLLRLLAAATARGELVALVDALDMFDAGSAAAAGIDLNRLLWIRGHVVSNPGLCRDLNQRAIEQAVKAFTLVLQAGNFGLVALDAGEAPAHAMRRLPFTTWFRLQRLVEGSQTASVLVGSEPMARSSAGLTIQLGMKNSESGRRFRGRLFDGLDVEARIVRARVLWQEQGTACGPGEAERSRRARASDSPEPKALGVGPQRFEESWAPRVWESACGPREQPGSPTRQPRWGGASESATAARVGVGPHANEMTSSAARASGGGAPRAGESACGPREQSESSSGAARASGGGAPRAVENVRVPLSTTCA